jgi:AraC-like DNA-binding protein
MSRGGPYLEQGSVYVDDRSLRATHRHNHIEINVAQGGSLAYRFGGQLVELMPDHIALFWAGIPHRLVDADGEAVMRWIHVPARRVLGWPMGTVMTQIFGGDVIVTGPGGDAPLDVPIVVRWQRLISAADPTSIRDAWTEIEVRFCELGRSLGHAIAAGPQESADAPERVEAMLLYIADHYGEPLETADVAVAAKLEAGDAAALFRRVVGSTFDDYLLELRLRHAAAHVTSSDETVETIARESGFGTERALEAAFRTRFGASPGDFRDAARGRAAR